jgi:serine/threonine protein kinase
MGVVYRARDTKFNRTVAIKLLAGDRADASARHRFEREAQIVAALNHPNSTYHSQGRLAEAKELLLGRSGNRDRAAADGLEIGLRHSAFRYHA